MERSPKMRDEAATGPSARGLVRLANATWLCVLVYLTAQWLIALRVSLLASYVFVLAFAICGLSLALVCLLRSGASGLRSVWVPALIGLALNATTLVVCIRNVVEHASRF